MPMKRSPYRLKIFFNSAALSPKVNNRIEFFLYIRPLAYCLRIFADVKYLQTGLKLRLEEEITKFSKTLNRDAQYIKTSRIARLPAYVSISLVRFFYKEKNSINAKILKDVKFSMNLDLYELCTPELQKKLLPMRQKFKEYEDKVAEKASKGGEKAEEPKEYYDYFFEDDQGSNNSGMYQLNGVLTHKGRSSSSGHYVAWIKNKGKSLFRFSISSPCNLRQLVQM